MENPDLDTLSRSLKDTKIKYEELLGRDKELTRKDTAESLCKGMDQIQMLMQVVLSQPVDFQERAYWILLNCTHQLFRWSRVLRKYQYPKLCTKYLAWCMLTMESNIVLLSTKHVIWRTRLYTELAEVYEEQGNFKSAARAVTHGQKQVLQLKEIEECEQPVPEVIRDTLRQVTDTLRTYEMKYGLLTGALNPDAWKKKLEEFTGKTPRLRAGLTCLSLFKPDQCRVVEHHGQKVNWKTLITTYCIDMANSEIQVVVKALEEIREKRKRDTELQMANQEEYSEKMLRNKEADAQMTKEPVWKAASAACPIEVHLELLRHAFDCKLWDHFYNLSGWAEVRIENRRIEAPVVTDVEVIFSAMPDSKVPRGFEKCEVDLNVAHFKSELMRLGIKEEEEKKEEKKVDPKAKGKQATAKDEEPAKVDRFAQVSHTYVYLTLKKEEEMAMAATRLEVKGDEPMLDPSQKALAIPIEGCSPSVPYIIMSKDPLESQSQVVDVIIDIVPIVSKHPDVQPPYGYKKLDFDLRQTPADQERTPNNTYVFICYKTDSSYELLRREFMLLSAFRKLENSLESGRKDSDPINLELGLTWDSLLLLDMSKHLSVSIAGSKGSQFASTNSALLIDIVTTMWNRFVLPLLNNVKIALERARSNEIELYLDDRWTELREITVKGLDTMLKILMTKVSLQDALLPLTLVLTLARLHEESNEVRYAVQILRMGLKLAIEAREAVLSRGVRSQDDKDISFCISADPFTVLEIKKRMADEFSKWELSVGRKIRALLRKSAIEEEEADEEEWEVLRKTEYQKPVIEDSGVSAYENTLNTLHLEVLTCLYRCELKLDRLKTKEYSDRNMQSKHLKPSATKGLSSGIVSKLELSKGKTATKIKEDVHSLQQTLQQSGKLPPSKPTLTHTEKILMKENGKNPYQQGLLQIQMTPFNSDRYEQKYLLTEAFASFEEAEKLEREMAGHAVKHAPQIEATKCFNYENNDSHLNHRPYRHLADPTLLPNMEVPPSPTILARSATTITIKMPYFKPKTAFNVKAVDSMALFGKEAGSGTSVCLFNYQFPGLNEKHSFDDIVHVKGLTAFEAYHFAAAGFSSDGECIGGIGKTSELVLTLLPLNLPILYSYLAEKAYDLDHKNLAVRAIDKVFQYYLQPNLPLYLLKSSLIIEKMQTCPLIAIRHLTRCLLIYVACLQHVDNEKLQSKLMRNPTYRPLLLLDKQQRQQKLANLLILAVETSIISNQPLHIKEVLVELNNLIAGELAVEGNLSGYLQVLSRSYYSLQKVPTEFWDDNFRELACLLSFQYFKHMLSLSLVLPSNNKLPIVRWPQAKPALALYEFALEHTEIQEFSKGTAELLKEALAAQSEEFKQQQKKSIDEFLDVFNGLKTTPDCGFSKINSTYKDNPMYHYFMIKVLWGLIEKGTPIDNIIQNMSQALPPKLSALRHEISKYFVLLDNDTPEADLVTPEPQQQEEEAEQPAEEEVIEPDTPAHLLYSTDWFLIQAVLQVSKLKPAIEEEYGEFFIQRVEIPQVSDRPVSDSPNLQLILENLMVSSRCCIKTQAWTQLENIARTLWNLLSTCLPSPISFTGDDSWKFLYLICEDFLSMLEQKKQPNVTFTLPEQSAKQLSAMSAFEEDDEVAWFLKRHDLNVQLYVNCISFSMQTLLLIEKWQYLQYFTARLNTVTQNHFASRVLPFKIHAEKGLYDKAKLNRKAKEQELEDRISLYEQWKATKKKKSRTAMLSGEIPKEQLDYERDSEILNKAIAARKHIEGSLLAILRKSEKQLEEIQRGASKAEESLVQSRKLLDQYGKESRALKYESEPTLKMKKNAHKVFANMVVSNYKKTVDFLRKRQENWLLAQALHELGSLQFSEGQVSDAEYTWNKVAETVFQSLYILDNYREVLRIPNDNCWRTEDNLAEKYGLKQCFLAGIALYKAATLCYDHCEHEKYRECLLLGRLVLSSVFRLSMPHPSMLHEFGTYRMQMLTPNQSIYEINEEIPVAEICLAAEGIGVSLVQNDLFAESLPLFTLLEFLACEFVWSPALAVQSRAWRAIALAQMGHPHQALAILQKITLLKDLPTRTARNSFGRVKEHVYFVPKPSFNCDLPPEDSKNAEAIQAALKLEFPQSMISECGLHALHLCNYAKNLLLYSLGKPENVDSPSTGTLLQESEKNVRSLLKNLAYEEEIARLKLDHQEGEMSDFIKSKAATVEAVEVTMKDQIIGNILSNPTNLSDSKLKLQRLQLMSNLRILLAKIKHFQGDLTSSIKTIKQALLNIKHYANAEYKPETGTETMQEHPAKKPGDDKSFDLKSFMEDWKYRNIPGAHNWLKLKAALCSYLYIQNRYQEALENIDVLIQEASQVNNNIYRRIAIELKACIAVRQGDLEKAIECFESVKSIGEQFGHADIGFGIALANYAEFLLDRKNVKDALAISSQAKVLLYDHLVKNGFKIDDFDINQLASQRNVLIFSVPKEEVKAADPKAPKQPPPDKAKTEVLVEASAESDINSGLIPPNIYIEGLDALARVFLFEAQVSLHDDTEWKDTQRSLDLINTALQVSTRVVNLPPLITMTCEFYKAICLKRQFIYKLLEYQTSYTQKYKKIQIKIPEYSLASGESLLELPLFIKFLTEDWLPILESAKACLERCIQLCSKESVMSDVQKIFLEMCEVCLLQSEYMPRVGFKYLPNTDESAEDPNAEFEELQSQHRARKMQYIKQAIRALSISNELFQAKDSVSRQFGAFAATNLADVNKIPKTYSQEILEAEYIQKKSYPVGLFDEAKKKTVITAIDAVTYLTKNYQELYLLSFGKEWKITRLCKFHRVLTQVSQLYAGKNKFVWDVPPYANGEELLSKGTVCGFWEQRRIGDEEMDFLNYVIAPVDPNAVKVDNEFSLEFISEEVVHGFIRINQLALVEIFQVLRDLKDKLRTSSALSSEKQQRDFVMYEEELKNTLKQFGKKFGEDVEEAVHAIYPQLNDENLALLGAMFESGTFSIVQPNICALMRKFHSLRYE